jgi:anti-sigma regulatory factor (Ser/Thr protein kinase)
MSASKPLFRDQKMEVETGDRQLSFHIPSAAEYAEEVLDRCEQFARQFGMASASEPVVVLQELIANAIEHGNKKRLDGYIQVKIVFLGDRQFKLVVEDEGEGFDYTVLDMRLPENPRRAKKRGYVLISALSHYLEFNERGNRVTALVKAG